MTIVKFITFTILTLLLNSCSSFLNFADESDIESALKKIHDKDKFAQTPIRPSLKGLEITNQKEETVENILIPQEDSTIKKIKRTSSKNLYFTLLYNQFVILKSYGDQEIPSISSCPYFHSNVVKVKGVYHAKTSPKINLKSTYNLDQSNLKLIGQKTGLYPELSLPINFDGKVETVLDIINKRKGQKIQGIVYNAYRIHLEKNLMELTELCETGVSNNYFIFENMLTHFKKHQYENNRTRALPILMKSLIFSNMALIESFESKMGPTSEKNSFIAAKEMKGTYHEILSRFSANWLKSYYSKLKAIH